MRHRPHYGARRFAAFVIIAIAVLIFVAVNPKSWTNGGFDPGNFFSSIGEAVGGTVESVKDNAKANIDNADSSLNSAEIKQISAGLSDEENTDAPLAKDVLSKLEVKGRAPKTNYSRAEFYDTWPAVDGCSLRQRIIKRELGGTAVLDGCNVVSGSYIEPYTGETKTFTERSQISDGIQIDHVVALSDAWQTGAQYKTKDERYQMATDPLNLLAVDSAANQQKSDGDAATWLPKNKAFRCQYVARQVSVKYKYGLWVTEPEHDAILKILDSCPEQKSVGITLNN